MRKSLVILSGLLSLVGCSSSKDPAIKSGDIGSWRPYQDPIDGKSVTDRYRLSSTDMRAFISLSCFKGEPSSLLTFLESPASFDTAVDATLRFDEQVPEKHIFKIPGSDTAAQYGSATRSDAVAFRNLLKGHGKLAIRIDKMTGLDVGEEPFVFNLAGVDNVVNDLDAACPK